MFLTYALLFHVCLTLVQGSTTEDRELKNVNQIQQTNALQRYCNLLHIKSNACKCEDFKMSYKNTTHHLCTNLVGVEPQNRTFRFLAVNLNSHLSAEIARYYCSYFNITEGQCKCNTIRIMYKQKIITNCAQQKIEPSPFFDTMYDLCKIFNVSRENCSCEHFWSPKKNKNALKVCDHFNGGKIKTSSVYMEKYMHTYATLATVSSSLGILGNSLVIFVAISYHNRRPVTCNKLIAHLAVYDLSFAVFQLIYVIPKFWTQNWLYGVYFCKIFRCTEYLGAFLAVGVILIICVERYQKIVHPFNMPDPSGKRLQMVLIINFILGLVAVIPLFLYYKIDTDLNYCDLNWPRSGRDSEIYNLVIFIAYFITPVLIITILYTKIILTIRSTSKTNDVKIYEASEDCGDQPLFQKRYQDNRRTIISLVVVVAAFVLFVFPKHIILIYFDQRGWNEDYISREELSVDMYYYLHYLAYIPYLFHVAVNPIIYSITDARWRRDFKKLFCKIIKLNKGNTNESVALTSGLQTIRHQTSNTLNSEQQQQQQEEEEQQSLKEIHPYWDNEIETKL